MSAKSTRSWPAIIAAASALALSTLALGCSADAFADDPGWFSGEKGVKETRTILVDHTAAKPLHITTANGAISVARATDSAVTITAKVHAADDARLKATQILTKRLDDGTLDIRVKWPDDKRKNNEGVSIAITLPDARGLHLSTSNGPIDASGMSGDAALDTSNGPIAVHDHDGPVKATSSNGPVSIQNASGPAIVNTSNAPVTIDNAVSPVKADTSNGRIAVSLRPDATGPVTLDTSNAPIHLTIGSAFAGSLAAGTSNARVTLTNIDAKNSKTGRTSATVQFTDSGDKSVLSTSNGGIDITRR